MENNNAQPAEQAEEKKESYGFWNPTPEELKKQVSEYDTLDITESYRGISLLIVLATLLFTFLISYFTAVIDDLIELWGLYYSLAVYIPLGILTFWGYRWSMVLLFIVWTLDKAIIAFQFGSIGSIVFWYILAHILWKAFQVENERNKILKLWMEKLYTLNR